MATLLLHHRQSYRQEEGGWDPKALQKCWNLDYTIKDLLAPVINVGSPGVLQRADPRHISNETPCLNHLQENLSRTSYRTPLEVLNPYC